MERPDQAHGSSQDVGRADVSLRVPAEGAYVSVPTAGRAEPDYESFAWQVLSTLSSETTAQADDEHLAVTFSTENSLALADGGAGG
jgi:hypothetical protein